MLRNRTSAVFGDTLPVRKKIRKRFDELYGLRSDYVHGNADAKLQTDPETLFQAREFARVVVLWLIRYLGYVLAQLGEGDLPTREALLQVLDMDSGRRHAMHAIISALPDRFPAVAEWKH
jgi:hypothetical protein